MHRQGALGDSCHPAKSTLAFARGLSAVIAGGPSIRQKFMFRKKSASKKTEELPEKEYGGEMNCLSSDEITVFREEFQEKEREIQRNIGIYLSGLVLVTGWLIGPQSKPLIKMALDNYGYNLFGFLAVVALNVVFACFLIYKSLIVHEITQFIAVHSRPNSVFSFWEAWRRSEQSVTKPVRIANSVILSVLPVFVSAAILVPLGLLLFLGDTVALSAELRQLDMRPDGTLPAILTTPEQLSHAFMLVKVGFIIVVLFHAIPFWFFYQNVTPTSNRWDEIHDHRIQAPSYFDIAGIPTCEDTQNATAARARDSNNAES
jgi:hypothetical protein